MAALTKAPWFRRLALGALLPLCLAGAPPATVHELKAVYLFQFTQFLTWPETAFRGADAPLVIGIHDQDEMLPILKALVDGERAAGRPIEVRRLRQKEEAASCHVAYSAFAEVWSVEPRLPVLLVGEVREGAPPGEAIRFILSRNRVRLHINLAEARARQLQIPSKLLRIAEKVEHAP